MENDKKIKLLYITEPMSGGVLSFLMELANSINKDFDITIAYGGRDDTPKNLRDLFDSNIKLIKIRSLKRELNFNDDIHAFFEIKKVVDDVKPDIIHLNASKAGVLGRLAINGKKVKLFYTPHGYSFIMLNFSPIKRKIFHFIEWICAKRCCTTISCSYSEYQQTLKLTNKAIYVNNGININKLDTILSTQKEISHPLTVFTLGRIAYDKNPELFNEIALSLPNIHFLWIGEGEMRNKLTAPNIEITGWLNRNDAIKRAYNADIFLLTSYWEGLSLSLLEAMYMKKLCIVSDISGNRNAIENNQNGYICKTSNEFVSCISKYEFSENIREKAYKDVIDNFTTKLMSEKYSKIYQSK